MFKRKKVLVIYLLITLIVLMVYIVGQQIFRQDANDPQVAISHDLANLLGNTTSLASNDLPKNIDLTSSLSPFVLVADEKGKTLVSTATIGGATPAIPYGVFARALKMQENRLTWQPQTGVREAIVVVHYVNPQNHTDQYVVAGRSLQEVEKRIDALGSNLFIGWLILMVVTSLLFTGNTQKPAEPVTVAKPKAKPVKRK